MRALSAVRIGVVLLTACGLSIVVSMALAAQEDDSAPRERVIVMTTGRILVGQVTRNAGGWLVEQANGRVQVPLDQVKLVADSLRDAYRKQRDSVVEPTPATHVALAQWCISYRLLDEARDELKKCLKLDPDNDEARKLLHRLDDTLRVKPQAAIETMPLKTSDGFVAPDVESLGGLSKEAATTFTSRVQPLLMNKCGNAACHGPASRSEFRLTPVRVGTNGHRLYSERNLAEALKYVDLHEPSLSQLIVTPQGGHGGAASIFGGPQGQEQLKTLRTWIKQVSQERQVEEQELAARPSAITKKKSSVPVAEASAASVPATETSTRETPPTTPASRRTTPGDTVPSTKTVPSPEPAIENEISDDPFDPNIFNRRFHGSDRSR